MKSIAPKSAPSPLRVDPDNPAPLYFQLKRLLEERIRSEEFPLDGQLPTEQELCQSYSISRITARRSLELMEQEGTIRRIRGKGSFVRKVPAGPASPPPL